MNIRMLSLALLCAAGVLAACNNSSNSYTPQPGAVSTLSAPALLRHWPLEEQAPDVATACGGIAPASVPGKHVFFFGGGTLSGSTFTGSGIWAIETYTIGTPGPSPTPGVTPTPGKGKVPPEYLYYGTYTLQKEKQSGCALLIATQSGKPFSKNSPENALGFGSVVTDKKWIRIAIPTTFGSTSITINGITPTSGTGSATLQTSKGKAFDTATIKLIGRLSFK